MRTIFPSILWWRRGSNCSNAPLLILIPLIYSTVEKSFSASNVRFSFSFIKGSNSTNISHVLCSTSYKKRVIVPNCTSPNIKTRRTEKWEQLKQSERHKGRRQRWHKEGRTGEGEALFRQSDNIPSPEHIGGCPLTPSRRSLWRQSEQLWPACRFPIISLAEGSGLPIHQQVWTCKLWWQSIRCYTNHTTVIPGIKYFTFTHNTLIISTRSFLATPPKNTWSQGILIKLLVESSTEGRGVCLAAY